jgi:hypothetical protein
MATLTLRPNATGDVYLATTPLSAATALGYINGASPGDPNVMSFEDASTYSTTRALFNFDNPSDLGTITNVEVSSRCQFWVGGTAGDDGTTSVRNFIKTGGTEYSGSTAVTFSDNDPADVQGEGIWTYVSNSWSTNPNTASAWTWSDLSSLQAGPEIQNGANDQLEVDHLYITVTYIAYSTVTYYWNGASDPQWDNDIYGINGGIDGSLSTFMSTNGASNNPPIQVLDSNNAPGTNLGPISSVYVRMYIREEQGNSEFITISTTGYTEQFFIGSYDGPYWRGGYSTVNDWTTLPNMDVTLTCEEDMEGILDVYRVEMIVTYTQSASPTPIPATLPMTATLNTPTIGITQSPATRGITSTLNDEVTLYTDPVFQCYSESGIKTQGSYSLRCVAPTGTLGQYLTHYFPSRINE